MCDPKARYFKGKTKLSNEIKLLKPLAMQSNMAINKALQHSKQKAEIRLANSKRETKQSVKLARSVIFIVISKQSRSNP